MNGKVHVAAGAAVPADNLSESYSAPCLADLFVRLQQPSVDRTRHPGAFLRDGLDALVDPFDAFRFSLLQTAHQRFQLRKLTFQLGDFAAELLGFLQDRKSTRLNSSHVAISYAVFCLTKNKI